MTIRFRTFIALMGLPLVIAQAQKQAARAPLAFEVTEASAGDLQRAMTAGQVTSTQLVDSYLARIAAYDHAGPSINAMLRLNSRARAEAVALDAERKAGKVRGPMHGIPIVLKDNYDTKDMITSAGSLALANHRPKSDAFVVAKLREAGAIIIGKTNLHELASGITSISSLGGQTLNPYDLSRCPGGSSGGTGAAVTASFAPIGWGTDTCGSILRRDFDRRRLTVTGHPQLLRRDQRNRLPRLRHMYRNTTLRRLSHFARALPSDFRPRRNTCV